MIPRRNFRHSSHRHNCFCLTWYENKEHFLQVLIPHRYELVVRNLSVDLPLQYLRPHGYQPMHISKWQEQDDQMLAVSKHLFVSPETAFDDGNGLTADRRFAKEYPEIQTRNFLNANFTRTGFDDFKTKFKFYLKSVKRIQSKRQ